jgi:hypothetical protein
LRPRQGRKNNREIWNRAISVKKSKRPRTSTDLAIPAPRFVGHPAKAFVWPSRKRGSMCPPAPGARPSIVPTHTASMRPHTAQHSTDELTGSDPSPRSSPTRPTAFTNVRRRAVRPFVSILAPAAYRQSPGSMLNARRSTPRSPPLYTIPINARDCGDTKHAPHRSKHSLKYYSLSASTRWYTTSKHARSRETAFAMKKS